MWWLRINRVSGQSHRKPLNLVLPPKYTVAIVVNMVSNRGAIRIFEKKKKKKKRKKKKEKKHEIIQSWLLSVNLCSNRTETKWKTNQETIESMAGRWQPIWVLITWVVDLCDNCLKP